MFPNNTIIIFPQTIYFSDDEEGRKVLDESIKIYNSHKNLYICCRETYTYNLIKDKFQSCNVMLVPDMVLYLDNIKNNEQRSETLFCIRNDKEKMQYNLDNVKQSILNNGIDKIDYTDTVIPKIIISNSSRKKIFENKLKQFSNYKLVVTDRLHGMIFALLSNTPCLVFENKSYKVRGVYNWIKDVNYIKLCNSEKMEEQIAELLNEKDTQYDNRKLLKKLWRIN